MNALVLLAEFNSNLRSWSLPDIIKAIIIVAAVLAVLFLTLKYFEIQIPPIAFQIFWICVIAFVAILAVTFLFSM